MIRDKRLGYDEANVFYDFVNYGLIWDNRELHSDQMEVWRVILERNPDLKLWWNRLSNFDQVEIMKCHTE
jgi:hypothetical protein